jgi:hypothetical protein
MFDSRWCPKPFCKRPASGKPPYARLCERHAREKAKQEKDPDNAQ